MAVLTYKNFIYISQEEKELVLEWRNSDRVRLKMNNKDIIEREAHFKWIETLKERKDCAYYLFYVDNIPVGVFDITNINDAEGTCYSGSYIGNTEYKGYGIILDHIGVVHTYTQYNINRILANVLKTNKRVYKMHKEFFHAKDNGETETDYLLYWDKCDYENYGKEFDDKLREMFEIERVEWVD